MEMNEADDQDLNDQAELINNLMASCSINENANEETGNDDDDDNEPPTYMPTEEDDVLNEEAEDYMIGSSNLEGGGIIGNDESDDYADNNEGEISADTRVPKLTQWTEVKANDNDFILTIGKACCCLWEQGKREIAIMMDNIKKIEVPSQHVHRNELFQVYYFLFGTDSSLCETFCRHLAGLTKIDYLRFLITYFTSCQNQTSLPMMKFSNVIDTTDFLEVGSYNLLWARISALSGSRRQNPFWMTLEEVVNKNLKNLFMSGSDEDVPYLLGIDDDKVHYNHKQNTTMDNLKPTHHVKDNKRGFTLHTAAFSAMCVPVAVMYQRDLESVQDTYLRILKFLFGSGGSETAPNLSGVTLASDRGYWKPALIFEHVLEWGAQVQGTVQRVSGLLL